MTTSGIFTMICAIALLGTAAVGGLSGVGLLLVSLGMKKP